MTIREAYELADRCRREGRSRQAEELYRGILAQQPGLPEVWQGLGIVLQTTGRAAEAAECYRRAIALRPDYAEAHCNLGGVLRALGRPAEAAEELHLALRSRPDLFEARNNLGNALEDMDRPREAAAAYREALRLAPDSADTRYNLGNAYRDCGQLDEAISEYRLALAAKPDSAETHANLGGVLKEIGELDEAVAEYRLAVALNPTADILSSLLYTLNFHPDYDAARIAREHARWDELHGRPRRDPPGVSDRSPDRRLRVGYVSPDFRDHPVGRFLLPLLSRHNRDEFEIFCWSDVRRPDSMTDALRAHADVWRDTFALSHETLADEIRRAGIDVLVDLTMHMRGNRLPVFALRPAPVQITYLAYCGTTGLSAMDFRLTDLRLDPPGIDESVYSETSIRLPRTYWCYAAPAQSPPVGDLPVTSGRGITFGCLNSFSKVTTAALEAWSELLLRTPGSSLLLHAPRGSCRETVKRRLAARRVDPARVQFADRLPTNRYLELYNRIDIALDPFPCGGGTTTCDALWMGVPVVSPAGGTAVSRAGRSILTNLGLPELAADDPAAAIDVAAALAGDIPRLRGLRSSLRERMRASALMDDVAFARDFEAALRHAWIRKVSTGVEGT